MDATTVVRVGDGTFVHLSRRPDGMFTLTFLPHGADTAVLVELTQATLDSLKHALFVDDAELQARRDH